MISEVIWRPPNDLGGRMTFEAIGGNMHMDTRVIVVADVKYEVI